MTSDQRIAAEEPRVAALAQLLLHGNFNELSPREQRVIAMIARRRPATRNVNHAVEDDASFGQRLADRVAQFGGSWTFIVIVVIGLAAWIVLNLLMFDKFGHAFDSYPFIFLNLVLSMVAALQAPVILMSQNRQANRDRVAAGLDYEVNLKSELEIISIHDKLDTLRIDRLEQLILHQQSIVNNIAKAVGTSTDPIA